jgi:hypothetical protein
MLKNKNYLLDDTLVFYTISELQALCGLKAQANAFASGGYLVHL